MVTPANFQVGFATAESFYPEEECKTSFPSASPQEELAPSAPVADITPLTPSGKAILVSNDNSRIILTPTQLEKLAKNSDFFASLLETPYTYAINTNTTTLNYLLELLEFPASTLSPKALIELLQTPLLPSLVNANWVEDVDNALGTLLENPKEQDKFLMSILRGQQAEIPGEAFMMNARELKQFLLFFSLLAERFSPLSSRFPKLFSFLIEKSTSEYKRSWNLSSSQERLHAYIETQAPIEISHQEVQTFLNEQRTGLEEEEKRAILSRTNIRKMSFSLRSEGRFRVLFPLTLRKAMDTLELDPENKKPWVSLALSLQQVHFLNNLDNAEQFFSCFHSNMESLSLVSKCSSLHPDILDIVHRCFPNLKTIQIAYDNIRQEGDNFIENREQLPNLDFLERFSSLEHVSIRHEGVPVSFKTLSALDKKVGLVSCSLHFEMTKEDEQRYTDYRTCYPLLPAVRVPGIRNAKKFSLILYRSREIYHDASYVVLKEMGGLTRLTDLAIAADSPGAVCSLKETETPLHPNLRITFLLHRYSTRNHLTLFRMNSFKGIKTMLQKQAEQIGLNVPISFSIYTQTEKPLDKLSRR